MLNIELTQRFTAQNVLLNEVVEAFNKFTNITESQSETGGMLYLCPDSIGERNLKLFQDCPREEDGKVTLEVIEFTKDRHGFDLEEINTYWVQEVEFRSATSASSIKWVAEIFPNHKWPEGVPGTFTFEQGTPNYFGAYFDAFMSVCKNANTAK